MLHKNTLLKYLATALFFFIGYTSYAQKLTVAIKLGGGVGYQHIDNDDILAVKPVSSFSFGGMANYNLPYFTEVQLGLKLARKGAVILEDGLTTTQRVTTIDVPLNLVKKFRYPGVGVIYAGGGGYFSTAIGGNVYYETPGSATSDKLEFGNDLDLKRFDAGLNFTAGIKLDNRLLFDFSYQYGLKNIATTRLTDTGTNEVESRMFTASLGYTFK